jgi:hypothetical protein
MTMTLDEQDSREAPTGSELQSDRQMELLLDEIVAQQSSSTVLPPDFTRRVVRERGFAPWEVRLGKYWRFPILAGFSLVASSLALFLAPLWSLGPATAFSLWLHLLAVALGRPILASFEAGPRLAAALSTLSIRPPAAVLGMALLLLIGGVALVLRIGFQARLRVSGAERGRQN